MQATERTAQEEALEAAVSHGRRVQYRALKAAAVRVGAALDSAKAGAIHGR